MTDKTKNPRTFVVAEIGINHNGNVDLAYKLIDKAVSSGADAVKFQVFIPELLTQDKDERTFLETLVLPQKDLIGLAKHSKSLGVEFFATPCDEPSLEFLVNDIGVERLKIASCDLTNGPLLLATARTRLNLIISTGMATVEDIRVALSVVSFGRLGWDLSRLKDELWLALGEARVEDKLEEGVTLLHCVTSYPTPIDQVNLLSIRFMQDEFKLPVGYSDHTLGIYVPTIAVAVGAVMIEKHLTFDRSMEGPDHETSLEPQEFKRMVDQIREVEMFLGKPIKQPQPCEEANLETYRRGLRAKTSIAKGEKFTQDNMILARPLGDGLSPMFYWKLLGERAMHSYSE